MVFHLEQRKLGFASISQKDGLWRPQVVGLSAVLVDRGCSHTLISFGVLGPTVGYLCPQLSGLVHYITKFSTKVILHKMESRFKKKIPAKKLLVENMSK